MRQAVAFTGPSNSGKTTLIEKISATLQVHKKIAILKHDPKDKAVFDTVGKDSHTFSATGAEVVVLSPTRTTFFSQESRGLNEVIALLGAFDLLLVEGLKTWSLPRIGVFRGEINLEYLPHIDALAIDESINLKEYNLPSNIEVLDLNNILQIIEWINTHAKAV